MSMKTRFLLPVFLLAPLLPAGAVDYKNDILPIMKERCWDCHSNDESVKGNLALDDFEEVRDYQIGRYNIIRPGNPDESNFVERLRLASSHNDFMPRKAEPLPEKEIVLIEEWIRKGAVIDAKNPTEDEKEWVEKSSTTPSDSSLSPSPEYRTWTSTEGKEIEARFLGYEKGTVSLLLKSTGKRADVPESRLSPESVEQARELAGAAKP